jgi:hypothetical protein
MAMNGLLRLVTVGLIVGVVLLSGCGAGSSTTAGSTTSGDATVNFVVTDTPPTAVTVLSFQLQIASAVLQPGNVSVLPRPVTVDLAQLATDTGFLASAVIGSATYTSLTVTLANPQVTLMNNTAAALSLNGQSCAVGAVCTYAPALDQASLTISSGVFPITVSANSTTGLAMDLSIPDLLQSDLSVSTASGASANFSLLPGKANVELGDVLGTVTAVASGQVSVTTAFGDSLVLTTGSTTVYSYPSSVCAGDTSACVAVGQIVSADLSLPGEGGLVANSLSYVGAAGSAGVKGLVLGVDTTGAEPIAKLLVQRQIGATGLTAGQIAEVTLAGGTTYGVGTVAYPAVAGGSFASAADVVAGQEIFVGVGSGSGTAFGASGLLLEPSQVVGKVAATDAGSGLVTVSGLSGLFTGAKPVVQAMGVQTGIGTVYDGFTVSDFAGIGVGDFLAAKGPLFVTTGGNVVGAVQVRARSVGN